MSTSQQPPHISQRQTTPLRTNKRGLPDHVLATLALDIEKCTGQSLSDYRFKWREEEYADCSRTAVRDRHRYTAKLKLKSNQKEWKTLVA